MYYKHLIMDSGNVCSYCLVNTVFFKCGKCQNSGYCGRECQVGDWKVHKYLCGVDCKIEYGIECKDNVVGKVINDTDKQAEQMEITKHPKLNEAISKGYGQFESKLAFDNGFRYLTELLWEHALTIAGNKITTTSFNVLLHTHASAIDTYQELKDITPTTRVISTIFMKHAIIHKPNCINLELAILGNDGSSLITLSFECPKGLYKSPIYCEYKRQMKWIEPELTNIILGKTIISIDTETKKWTFHKRMII